MKLIALVMLATSAYAAEIMEAFGMKWDVPFANEWKFENGVLKLITPRPQQKDPRRPVQFALAQTANYGELEIDVEVKRNAKSMIIVYAYEKPGHFNYAHISDDMALKQPVHNGIFHCYNGDRVRISSLAGPSTLPTEDWTPVKLKYDAKNGRVQVWAAGVSSPSMIGVDLRVGAGRVGLGSFFDSGDFRRLKVKGTTGKE